MLAMLSLEFTVPKHFSHLDHNAKNRLRIIIQSKRRICAWLSDIQNRTIDRLQLSPQRGSLSLPFSTQHLASYVIASLQPSFSSSNAKIAARSPVFFISSYSTSEGTCVHRDTRLTQLQSSRALPVYRGASLARMRSVAHFLFESGSSEQGVRYRLCANEYSFLTSHHEASLTSILRNSPISEKALKSRLLESTRKPMPLETPVAQMASRVATRSVVGEKYLHGVRCFCFFKRRKLKEKLVKN